MLSLLKKTGGDKAAAQVIPWRPDFRDLSQLPDTKTVRTAFFVNVLAITLTGVLALFVAQREWEIASLRESLADVEARIASTEPASKKAQAAYQLFLAEEKKFQEAYAFVSDPFRFPEFVLHLGSVLPPNLNVRRIEFRGLNQNVLVTCGVKGLDAAATDIVASFVKDLQADPLVTTHFSSVQMANIGRNVEEGTLSVELVFTFKSNAPKATPAKKK